MNNFFSKSLLVSGLILISKILGFVRDLLLARFFGSGDALQAFLVVFRLPEFMRKITTSGSLTQVVNPYINNKTYSEQRVFIATILYFVALVLLIITIFNIVFSNAWINIYAYGLMSNLVALELVHNMFIIIIPYILFSGVVGIIAAVLNSFSKYIISSLLPIVLNLIIIIGIIVSPYFNIPIYAVAYSVIIAGLFQLGIAMFSLYKLLGKIKFNKEILFIKNLKAKLFLKKLPMAFLGTAVLQINMFVETFFASFLLSGSLAWLYYADRVNQFLYGIFGSAVAIVMIPYLLKYKNNATFFTKDWH